MVKEIEEAMEQRHRRTVLDVSGDETASAGKIAAVANKIGYPDKWRDYSTLTIARDDAMGNVLARPHI